MYVIEKSIWINRPHAYTYRSTAARPITDSH